MTSASHSSSPYSQLSIVLRGFENDSDTLCANQARKRIFCNQLMEVLVTISGGLPLFMSKGTD